MVVASAAPPMPHFGIKNMFKSIFSKTETPIAYVFSIGLPRAAKSIDNMLQPEIANIPTRIILNGKMAPEKDVE